MPTSHTLTPDVIKTARTDAGMTQVELAAALIDATPQELHRLKEFFNALMTVRTWESGKHPPDPRNTRALIRILDLDQE